MGYFAGLDVSLEETAIGIIDGAGNIVREARAASEPEVLVAFFRASGMEMERVGLEACSLTAWLHAGLTEAGIPAICIETRQAKAAMGAMPNKTDRNDARGIAQIMRTGPRPSADGRPFGHGSAALPPMVSCGACEEPDLPLLASAADRTADGAQQAPRCGERTPRSTARGRTEGRHTKPQGLPGPRSRLGCRRPGVGQPG